MNGGWFDELARILTTAGAASRRSALRAVGSGVLAVLLTRLGAKEATAKRRCTKRVQLGQICKLARLRGKCKCRGGAKCRGQRCKCPGGRQQCRKKCCQRGQRCVGGRCVRDENGGTCPTGQEICDGQCVDPLSDPNHCMDCGIQCGNGNGTGECLGGGCVCETVFQCTEPCTCGQRRPTSLGNACLVQGSGSGQPCEDDAACPAGEICFNCVGGCCRPPCGAP